jgi:hypothetical protein
MANSPLISPSGAPLLDLTGYSGQTVSLAFSVSRAADDNSSIGFYKVLDREGSVSLNSSSVLPGQINYASAALAPGNLLSAGGQNVSLGAPNNASSNLSFDVSGGELWAPYASNSSKGITFFSWSTENPSQFSNVRNNGGDSFSLEDIPGGGDNDFNDLQVSASVTKTTGGGSGGGGGGSGSGGGGSGSGSGGGPVVPVSYFSLSDAKVLEGDTAKVLITRSGNLNTEQHLVLQSFGGTATLGKDYNKVDEKITFATGQKTYTSLVPTLNDSRAEPTEFISLHLTPDSSKSDSPVPSITRQIGYVSILDGDDDNFGTFGPGLSGFGGSNPVAVSGGIQATGGATVNVPAGGSYAYGTSYSTFPYGSAYYGASAVGPAYYVSSPYYTPYSTPAAYFPGYGPALYADPSPQTIAISGGVSASGGSTISIGVDTIAPGVNVGSTVIGAGVAPHAFVVQTPFNAVSATSVDILHFLQTPSLQSFGVAVPFATYPGTYAAIAHSQIVPVMVTPQQMGILQSGSLPVA